MAELGVIIRGQLRFKIFSKEINIFTQITQNKKLLKIRIQPVFNFTIIGGISKLEKLKVAISKISFDK